MLRIHLSTKEDDIQKQKGLPLTLKSECHTDWKSEGIIAIRPVPVFITSSAAGLNAALHSSKASLGKEAVVVASRVDQMTTEPTALDHWTLNLLLSVGCDVISQWVRTNTKGAPPFSVQLSRVTAGVNRLFEASEEWGSRVIFSLILALKLLYWQAEARFNLKCLTLRYPFSIITAWSIGMASWKVHIRCRRRSIWIGVLSFIPR